MSQEAFEKNYKILNPQQKEAVETLYGPAMVVAGPGTGKTQIIALRTANIILKTGINPENILITTFTEAGVIAIRERLISFIGEDAYKVHVSTIHSFSQDVIKTFPEKFIEHKAGSAIDDVDQMEILKDILEKEIDAKSIEYLTSSYNPFYYLRDIKSRISTLKQEGVTPEKFKVLIKKQEESYAQELSEIKPTLKKYETTKEKQQKHIAKLCELQHIYTLYNTQLKKASQYDFNDMINFVLEKFRDDTTLRLHYAEIYQFIMLDEYQDTNNPQNEIVNMILSESIEEPNIMVVGDDDQSIYRFQGANIENMLNFYTLYPKTKFIVLVDNYRSNQHILNTAQELIKNNTGRLTNQIDTLDKHLTARGKYKDSAVTPMLYRALNDTDEDAYILNTIKNALTEGTAIDEIAIIVRNNNEVKKWTSLLSQNGIESESKIQSNILESDYVRFILNFIEIIEDPYTNDRHLIDILRTDIIGLSQSDVLKINRHLYIENYRRKIPLRFIDILSDTKTLESLELSDTKAFILFQENLFLYTKKLQETSLRNFFSFFIEHTNILEYITKNGSFDDIQDVYTLLNTVKTWSQNTNLSIQGLFQRISLYKEYNYTINRQILKKSQQGVQVMTAHSSKGLEYEIVFIPGLYTGNWDGKRIPDKLKLPFGIAGQGVQELQESALEEERRLFFVALTRARNKLFLSFPAGKDKKPLLPSMFLEEISSMLTSTTRPKNLDNILEKIIYADIHNSLISYTDLEFDYISEFLKTYKLSPSDLNTFLSDPLEFLSRVVFKYPFNGNKFTIFGTVYHRTLELFLLKYKNEQKIPEKSYLTSTFSYLIQQELLTPQELEEAIEKGIAGLEGYYDTYAQNLQEPFLLEYSFRRKNISYKGIPLTGTIDKIEKSTNTLLQEDVTPKGGQMAFFKDSVTLIDYKTGKTKTENTIKGLDRYGNKKENEGGYFRQLMFYKLLCENDREFMEKFAIESLAIDFVEGKDNKYTYVELTPSDEEFEVFLQELEDAWKQISNIDFWKSLLTK